MKINTISLEGFRLYAISIQYGIHLGMTERVVVYVKQSSNIYINALNPPEAFYVKNFHTQNMSHKLGNYILHSNNLGLFKTFTE